MLNKKLKYLLTVLVLSLLFVFDSFASNNTSYLNNSNNYGNGNNKNYNLNHNNGNYQYQNMLPLKDVVYSYFDDVELDGTIHIEIMEHKNKGKAFGVFDGDIAEPRMLNTQGTRLKLGVSKKLSDRSKINFTIKESHEKGLTFEDVYFTFNITDELSLYVGQKYARNFLLIEDDADIMLMPNFVRFNRVGDLFNNLGFGVSATYFTDTWGIDYGVYGNDVESKSSDKNQVITNLRGYYSPYNKDGVFVHLGASYYYKNETFNEGKKFEAIDGNGNAITTPTPTELAKIKSFNLFDIRNLHKVGFEAIFNYKNYNLMGEYNNAWLFPAEKSLRNEDVHYHINGYYIQASTTLTGEYYSYSKGMLNPYKVKNSLTENGFGAFELGFRYAFSDMRDGNATINPLVYDGFDYGVYKEYTAMLNWAATDFLRIILSYSRNEEKFDNMLMQSLNNKQKNNKYDVYMLTARIYF